MTIRSGFFNYVAQTSPFSMAFEVSHAKGSMLYDMLGKAYIDCISGIGVSNLGHSNPAIIAAIHHQIDAYLHTMVYGEHIQSPQVLLAKKLAENLPLSLQRVYFLSSGAEAIDCSIKLARKFTNRKKIVASANAYHGSTLGAMSLMSDKSKTVAYGGGLDVQFVTYNDLSSLHIIDENTSCVITEVIQAEAGIHLPQEEFLSALATKCRETGTLLIFDEIQSGMGRAGSLFAFEQYGITPDILVLGKSLGGGMPLSACIASDQIMYHIANDPPLTHMTTFGGHPVCCAAGLAALDILVKSDIISQSRAKAQYFIENIQSIDAIKEIRSTRGMWMALDLGNADKVQTTITLAMEHGLLTDWFLFNDESIRIAPPLTISDDEIENCIEVFRKIL